MLATFVQLLKKLTQELNAVMKKQGFTSDLKTF
jgi:hypothetical protein